MREEAALIMAAFGAQWVMRIDSGPMAALLLSLAALAGCAQPDWMKPDWTKPEEKAFADSDRRCSQVAMKAAPINEARVVDCDRDRGNVNCGTNAELKTTLKLPAPEEAQAVRETNLARRQAYSDCMARPGG
jgi:hypothetical protein